MSRLSTSMRVTTRPASLATLVCALLLLASRAFAAETALFVDGDSVRLRSAPSETGSEILAHLGRGDEVRVKAAEGQWRKVWVPSARREGWVAHWLLSEVPPEGMRREVAYVKSGEVNIRTGPGESYARKGVLAQGIQVDVIAYADQWRKIRVPSNGEFGWVAGWLLTSDASTAGSASANARPSYYGDSRWVKDGPLNLRTNPSTGAEPIAKLKTGTRVYLMQMNDKWVKVHVHQGPIGWVHRDYLGSAPVAGAQGGVLGGPAASGADNAWGEARHVGVEELYLRPGPDTENEPMAILTRGKTVYLMYLQEDWAQVHVHGGDIGWVFRDYLKAEPIEGHAGSILPYGGESQRAETSYSPELGRTLEGLADNQGVVTKTDCNLRAGPGTMFAKVTKVSRPAVLTIHGQASGWFKVTTSSGQAGWILAALCATRVDPPTLQGGQVPAPPSIPVVAGAGDPQGIGKRIAELALSQVGKPYVWGAESPSQGFDCSGLVYWSHGQVGISMMRTTWDIWADGRGKAVPDEQLQPGDVVCFFGTYRPGCSHVGIYVGDGKYVHAPGTGKTVRVESLSGRSRSFGGSRRFY